MNPPGAKQVISRSVHTQNGPRKLVWSLAKARGGQDQRSISNGSKSVPAIFVPPMVVTKDNVKQTVITDGF